MSIKTKRIASLLMEEISDILQNEVNDSDIRFVTITDCKVDADLTLAQVYCTVLDESKKDKCLHDLNEAKGFIKTELAKRKLEIRRIPDLRFIYDESIEYASRIEKIISEINE
ncbi:MAG TPA: 30S ribosome-binding factor RbfA [Candidatus Aphodocola excrementigallinarum]|uniref:Ribosome-binding factor A n=1 Tax=Candidatus Aphodocola excrementigallinarum TaxID=2840670 RepID=A0A9D1LIK0_9FIRM|nr:30S ribosome-binding factor RbfA [Candidatus Aphodocola excrementigallinarum]